MTLDELRSLSDVAEQYFGIQPAHARRRATEGALPVPAFRLNNLGRGPFYVTQADLDEYVDKRATEATKLHRLMANRKTKAATQSD